MVGKQKSGHCIRDRFAGKAGLLAHRDGGQLLDLYF
jgi:hypothetical protein